MDNWLTNDLKEAIAHACLQASKALGARLNARLQRGQTVDERALTEDLVDHLDSRTALSVWGAALGVLRNRGAYLNIAVEKSSRESQTGADIGFIIDRHTFDSRASYAALVQCKKVKPNGKVDDFFHQVGGTGAHQSDLLLSITPSAFYFVFVPPALVPGYVSLEPIGFIRPSSSQHVPVWNMGTFAIPSPPLAPVQVFGEASAIMVVPALAVAAQMKRNTSTAMGDILANSTPFWYWFAELLIPGFVGDRRDRTLDIAANTGGDVEVGDAIGVRNSVRVDLGVEG